MKKLFTLALAMLASVGLWAADPTLPADATPTTTLDAAVKDANLYAITNAVHNNKQYYVYDLDTIRVKMKAGNVTWIKGPKNDGGNSAGTISFASDDSEVNYGFNSTWNRAWGINNSRYAGIRVTNCVEFAALTKSNSTKDGKTLYMHVFKKNADSWDFVESVGTETYNNSKYYVLSATLDATKEYVVLLTSGNSSNCLTAQIRFASPYCADAGATIIEDQAGFVGDAIDLEYSSDNTSDVEWDVTLDDAAAVENTDYEWVTGDFKPLAAGVFVITATQEADGTHCAVEDGDATVTLTIGTKTPVTSVSLNNDAPATARVGQEITLTATAANATDFQWTLGGENISGATNSSYTFEAAVGTYNIACKARNDFNEVGEWISSATHTITVSISNDATLSALAVTGKALDPVFAPATTEYSVGEIGIYEKLTITYTVNDAGYATAVLKNAIVTDGKDTVVVTAEDGETVKEYIINYTRAAATALASINDNTTWDFTKTGSTEVKFTASTNPQKDVEFNFADVLNNPDASFNASALIGAGEYAVRGGDYFQGNYVRFNTTVAGTMTVVYSNTSDRSKGDGETEGQESQRRFLTVNDALVSGDAGTMKQAKANATTVSNIPVAAGNVKIGAVRPYYTGHTTDAQYLRIYSIVFTKSPATALDNAADEVKAVKRIENGQLFIEKNGVIYNAQGARLQ